MRLILKLLSIAAVLLVAGCESSSAPPPPSPDSLIMKLPVLFKSDNDAYAVLVKNDEKEITAEHRLIFDGIGPILIAKQEVIVWKVAPGIHVISHGARQGDRALRVEVFPGNRVVFEVDAGGGLFIRSFANDWDRLAANTRLSSYHDMSDQAPPEPGGRRR